jgi:uncharacterized protein YqjF (DUF2071 family)
MERPAVAREVRWVWRQMWRDVLFLHWRVAAADLRPHVPPDLSIDTLAGDAWVSIVLFRLRVAPIGLPFVPGFSSLVEVNLRTYVALNDHPGIFFLSIHADNLAALSVARLLTPLPYAWANIRYRPERRRCACEMRRLAAPGCRLSVQAQFGAAAPLSGDDSGQTWLLERYRAFAPARHLPGSLLTAVVAHEPWRVVPARAELQINSLGGQFALDLNRPPDAAHFCEEMAARFSRFEPCNAEATARLALPPPASG